MVKILVVNYGAGNLQSIKLGLESQGVKVLIEEPPFSNIGNVDAIILPGVGAFKPAMTALEPVKEQLLNEFSQGKPLLGICLGLQLLFTESAEGTLTEGLNILPGVVSELQTENKIPQIGWNNVLKVRDNPLLENIPNESYFYFVHSFVVYPENDAVVVANTNYGQTFPSIIAQGNLFATQFHPEKSSKVGRKMLANFIRIVKR